MSVAALAGVSYVPVERAFGAPPSVLIVEDQRSVRWSLIEQFRAMGIVPYTATTGFEAIRLAGEHRPDLILLDGLLPQMHGFEVARFIRRLDRNYHPHIALMTAIYKNMRYQNEARLKYGIDEYLLKPLAADALTSLVQRVKEVR